MRRDYERKTSKGRGQVRDERKSAPIYTAVYKVGYSDTLLAFLLKVIYDYIVVEWL